MMNSNQAQHLTGLADLQSFFLKRNFKTLHAGFQELHEILQNLKKSVLVRLTNFLAKTKVALLRNTPVFLIEGLAVAICAD